MPYLTTVVSQGVEADSFLADGLAITFGADAPEELKPFCFVLASASLEGSIKVGQRTLIADQSWTITAIGEVAQQNLAALGHVTFIFDGAKVPQMAGAIHLGGCSAVPALAPGVRLEVGSE